MLHPSDLCYRLSSLPLLVVVFKWYYSNYESTATIHSPTEWFGATTRATASSAQCAGCCSVCPLLCYPSGVGCAGLWLWCIQSSSAKPTNPATPPRAASSFIAAASGYTLPAVSATTRPNSQPASHELQRRPVIPLRTAARATAKSTLSAAANGNSSPIQLTSWRRLITGLCERLPKP